MLEHVTSARASRALASAACMILPACLAGCALGALSDGPGGTGLDTQGPIPQNDVPCVEGLALRPGDSCVHDGGRFRIDDGQACYSGRHLAGGELVTGPSDEFCSSSSIRARGEVCLDRQERRAVLAHIEVPLMNPSKYRCSSYAFGFGAELISGTPNWQISQIRRVRQVDWDGRAVQVEGNCSAMPGTSSNGPCLRLQIAPPGGACIIRDYSLRLVCDRLDATLLNSGKVRINGFTECGGLSTRRYSPVVCKAH